VISTTPALPKLDAALIAFHLDAQERAAEQEAALVDARDAASLREQFVAILAHDLRNPLASIDAGINVLLHRGPDEKTLREGAARRSPAPDAPGAAHLDGGPERTLRAISQKAAPIGRPFRKWT
jgi:signal transduction histidine kinase